VIRVYDEAGNVIETHEHVGEFKLAAGPPRQLRILNGIDKVSARRCGLGVWLCPE
jgi:hypothetical protein